MRFVTSTISRRLLAAAIVFGAAATLTSLTGALEAQAGTVRFSPEKFEKVRKSGKPVLLDFFAVWCGTCRRQHRVLEGLRLENKAYEKIAFMRVDWDTYGSKPISRDLKIPRRSTLVMFKDGKEVGRIVAGTSVGQIKSLLDKGL